MTLQELIKLPFIEDLGIKFIYKSVNLPKKTCVKLLKNNNIELNDETNMDEIFDKLYKLNLHPNYGIVGEINIDYDDLVNEYIPEKLLYLCEIHLWNVGDKRMILNFPEYISIND